MRYARTTCCKYLTILRYMQEKKENNTKIICRLQEYVDCKGITLNQIAVSTGVSNSYFSKMAKAGGSVGEDIIRKILLFYDDLNPDWLLTGRGEMIKSSAHSQPCTIDSVHANLVQALADANKALAAANDTISNQQKMIANIINTNSYPPPRNLDAQPILNPVDKK